MSAVAVPKKLSPSEYERRKQIGVALRKLRERKHLSLEQAAAEADVSLYTWQRWEQGRTAIPLELVANICRALGQSILPSIEPHLRAA